MLSYLTCLMQMEERSVNWCSIELDLKSQMIASFEQCVKQKGSSSENEALNGLFLCPSSSPVMAPESEKYIIWISNTTTLVYTVDQSVWSLLPSHTQTFFSLYLSKRISLILLVHAMKRSYMHSHLLQLLTTPPQNQSILTFKRALSDQMATGWPKKENSSLINLSLVNLTEYSTHSDNFTVPKEYVIKTIDFDLENVVSSKIYKKMLVFQNKMLRFRQRIVDRECRFGSTLGNTDSFIWIQTLLLKMYPFGILKG